jgi:hypothetical protein
MPKEEWYFLFLKKNHHVRKHELRKSHDIRKSHDMMRNSSSSHDIRKHDMVEMLPDARQMLKAALACQHLRLARC